MATVLSTARTLGEHLYLQEEISPWLSRWLDDRPEGEELLLRMCRNSQVAARSSVIPIEEIFRERRLEEKNNIYRENALFLGRKVAEEAIERAGLSPREIDLVLSVSCTGFMIPSIDAYLINALGMRLDTKRLPITEMGCAAGATALSRAYEYLRAFPDQKVLVLSVELATLTFQPRDFSKDNMVSVAIFGDGAAAAVLGGNGDGPGPQILGSQTTTLPDTTHLMGFNLVDTGFQIVLSREIPSAVRKKVRPLVEDFLGKRGLRLEEIDHLLFHPGGKRILEVYQDELGVSEDALLFSRKVLRECGNVSSSTVLMILDEILRSGESRPGDTGLMMAMGPGFTIEQLLFRWRD